MSDINQIEEGTQFHPKFSPDGLITCVTISAKTGHVLMVAYMNHEALEKTIATGEAHYWSRSRKELWHKGATSGHTQKLVSLKTDCDQDCLLMSVELKEEVSCHTGRESCFYREVDLKDGSMLRFVD